MTLIIFLVFIHGLATKQSYSQLDCLICNWYPWKTSQHNLGIQTSDADRVTSMLAYWEWHNSYEISFQQKTNKQTWRQSHVRLTFAILPSRVPRQAKERCEENNRSGNRSISEPHLIAPILLGSCWPWSRLSGGLDSSSAKHLTTGQERFWGLRVSYVHLVSFPRNRGKLFFQGLIR